MASTYNKLWLTVIAIFLSVIALKGAAPIENAHAQSGMGGMGPGDGADPGDGSDVGN